MAAAPASYPGGHMPKQPSYLAVKTLYRFQGPPHDLRGTAAVADYGGVKVDI